MYRMIQPNIRGGICHASVRYASANNKLMGSLYDPWQPTSYIMEVNAYNLYGWAMSLESQTVISSGLAKTSVAIWNFY